MLGSSSNIFSLTAKAGNDNKILRFGQRTIYYNPSFRFCQLYILVYDSFCILFFNISLRAFCIMPPVFPFFPAGMPAYALQALTAAFAGKYKLFPILLSRPSQAVVRPLKRSVRSPCFLRLSFWQIFLCPLPIHASIFSLHRFSYPHRPQTADRSRQKSKNPILPGHCPERRERNSKNKRQRRKPPPPDDMH